MSVTGPIGTPSPPSAVFASGYTPGTMHGLSTDPHETIAPAKTYARARNALILGILTIVVGVLAGIPAIVVGRKALVAIDASDGALKGRGAAWTGIIMGWLSILVVVAWLLRVYA